jgi:hypothetical protein
MKPSYLAVGLSILIGQSDPVQASLIGDTIQYSNVAYPDLNTTLVVGPGPELSVCYIPDGPNCLLSYELNVGANYIAQTSFNDTDRDFPVLAGANLFTDLDFGYGRTLTSVIEVLNTFPTPYVYSFGPDSLSFLTSAFSWAAHTRYDAFILLQTSAVSAPETLSLFGVGLAGLVALRRRRCQPM